MELKNQESVPYITILFIIANILIWLILEIMGDTQDSYFMIEHGAAYEPLIHAGGEFYRLFTCMFLHFGADHLMNNMLVLGVAGMVYWEVSVLRYYICAPGCVAACYPYTQNGGLQSMPYLQGRLVQYSV